ncbi:MAG: hypothetical protein IJ157_00950 [Clostridia bacterium]|nr:hypothetical protein [Clostridia bacterium]
MRAKWRLRPLGVGMADTYSAGELYDAFERLVFSRGTSMDVPLLRETLLALDDRADEDAAPHAALVWRRLCRRIRKADKPAVMGLSRRGIALLAALLVLLLAAAAMAMTNWSAIERIFRLEHSQGSLDNWTLEQKQSVADALAESGYDMSALPDLSVMNDKARDSALTQWLNAQFNGDVTAAHYNLMTSLKGLLDGWSLTDKAWYSSLLLEGGEVQEGDFVSVVPKRGQREGEIAVALADEKLREAYDGSSLDTDTLIPYLFYGYLYPHAETLYWRVHYRNAEGENWFTVLVPDTEPESYTAQTVYRRPSPEELSAILEESSRKAQERHRQMEKMEAERGLMITWTLSQQAEWDPGYYGVPGPGDITREQAHAIARQAYCEAMGVDPTEADALYVYSYFIIAPGADGYDEPFYSVALCEDREGRRALPITILISHDGRVLLVSTEGNG